MAIQRTPARQRGRDYLHAFGLVGGIMALCWGCSVLAGEDKPGGQTVRSSEVTADQVSPWPFTVASGTLRCRGGVYVTVEIAGVEYALNGSAEGAGYPPVDPVWAVDPQLSGLRLNLRPALEAGRALC